MSAGAGQIERSPFGRLPGGEQVECIALSWPGGLRARVLTLGCILASLEVPDRSAATGRVHVVLGFDDLASYLRDRSHQGAVVGRVANRIAGARFEFGGHAYALPANAGPHHLHGGPAGFHARLWTCEARVDAGVPELRLSRVSADGEEGYPGELHCRVIHRLERECLSVVFEAETRAPTLVNLAHHPYLDLSGGVDRDVSAHTLQIAAEHYLPLADGLVPTGERRAVAGTPFDFRAFRPLQPEPAARDEQLRRAGGYDHCFALDGLAGELRPAACLSHPESGRALALETTQAGLQLYTSNSLGGDPPGRAGISHGRHRAVCLEAQAFPNACHQPDFPSTVLRPGERYRHETRYRLSWPDRA